MFNRGPRLPNEALTVLTAVQLQLTATASSLCPQQVFPNELEAQAEYDGFTEWLQTFELYRGKQTEEEFEDDGRVVGKFKVSRQHMSASHKLS